MSASTTVLCPKDSNDVLRIKFRKLQSYIVQLDLSSVIDELFADGIIDTPELDQLEDTPVDRKTRKLLIILHKSSHPQAFVGLYRALIASHSVHAELLVRLGCLDENGSEKHLTLLPTPPVHEVTLPEPEVQTSSVGGERVERTIKNGEYSTAADELYYDDAVTSNGDEVIAKNYLAILPNEYSEYDTIPEARDEITSIARKLNPSQSVTGAKYEALMATSRHELEPAAATDYSKLDADGEYEALLATSTSRQEQDSAATGYSKLAALPPARLSNPVVAALTGGQSVRGVVALRRKLYVVRLLSPDVEVYSTLNYKQLTILRVPEMKNPTDIAASHKPRSLYVVDTVCKPNTKMRAIRGRYANLVTREWSVGDYGTTLSVSESCSNFEQTTILVTCPESRSLQQFTVDGQLLRCVKLHRDFVNPSHAVILPSGNIAVSWEPTSQPCPRVSVLDPSTGYWPPVAVYRPNSSSAPGAAGALTSPHHMAVSDNGKFVYVADGERSLILKLNLESMNVEEEFAMPDEKNFLPVRLSVSVSRDHLYVASNPCTDHMACAMGHVTIYALNSDSGKIPCKVS